MIALQKLRDAADTLLAEVESGGSYQVTREALRKALDDADAVLKAPATGAEPVTDDELAEVERLDREATPGPWMREWYEDGESSEGPHGVHPGSRGDMVQSTDVVTVPSEDRPESIDVGYTRSGHDADFMVLARGLLPALAAEVRANRRSLDEANAALRRVAAEVDSLKAKLELRAALTSEERADHVTVGQRRDRDRVRRLFDHHLTGLAVDDDVKRALAAFAADVASGVDRRPA